MYDDILVPTDGSEGVQRAIDHGIDLAALTDATVHALFVVDTAEATAVPDAEWLTVEGALEEAGERAVADVADRARERGVDVTTEVRHGAPHEGIVAYADEHDVDLVVMGTHGRSGIDRVILGSVTENVIRETERPVLVQRIED
ncbi:MAG: universal stress protein [Halobacteriaceae archaeon]